ncbi:MAG TPA: hypothetical protein VK636_10550 [Gemmatimonadaceae bacterium]|nr:hypothetical protein [Gemmatimonadaceae bacterium]
MTESEKAKQEQILRFAQEDNVLSECQLEIERAWNDARDDSPVHRLAAAHPDLADELYDFFVCVVEANDNLGDEYPDFAETEQRARELIAGNAQAPPTSQVAPKKTFLALVRDTTGEYIDDIAGSMDLPPDFLVDASEHGRILPRRAREELVRRACRTRTIDEAEALAAFDVPPSLRRAASRNRVFEPSNDTYKDVVERSSLSAEAKRFWLSFAEHSPRTS